MLENKRRLAPPACEEVEIVKNSLAVNGHIKDMLASNHGCVDLSKLQGCSRHAFRQPLDVILGPVSLPHQAIIVELKSSCWLERARVSIVFAPYLIHLSGSIL